MHRLATGSFRLAWRLGVFVVGTALLLAGIVMIVTPGPAVVFIPLGLGVLATEFQWARRLLGKARPMLDRAIEKARSRHPDRHPTPPASTRSGDHLLGS
jgi:tellurite resistance protein TerC